MARLVHRKRNDGRIPESDGVLYVMRMKVSTSNETILAVDPNFRQASRSFTDWFGAPAAVCGFFCNDIDDRPLGGPVDGLITIPELLEAGVFLACGRWR